MAFSPQASRGWGSWPRAQGRACQGQVVRHQGEGSTAPLPARNVSNPLSFWPPMCSTEAGGQSASPTLRESKSAERRGPHTCHVPASSVCPSWSPSSTHWMTLKGSLALGHHQPVRDTSRSDQERSGVDSSSPFPKGVALKRNKKKSPEFVQSHKVLMMLRVILKTTMSPPLGTISSHL